MKIQKAYTATDVHVAGEAFRIIKDAPFIHYESLARLDEQFSFAYKDVINLLLNEPRGFAGLNGCLVVPPFNRDADAAVLFFNHDGTVPLHYGGIVAVITALLECGQLQARASNEYKMETVNGIISVLAVIENEEVISVELESEPFNVVQTNIPLKNANFTSQYSLVQGDHLYAIFDKNDVPFEICLEDLSEIKRWEQAVNNAFDSKLATKNTVLLEDSILNNGRIKTVTFRQDHLILRSPGFGTTAACYAHLLANGETLLEQSYENESIFNSLLSVRLSKQTESGYQFMFTCRGFITGMQTYVLDPDDPLAAGFLLK